MDERLKRRWSRWLLNSAIFSGESDGDRYMELKDDFFIVKLDFNSYAFKYFWDEKRKLRDDFKI